jgi:hypothetical protein
MCIITGMTFFLAQNFAVFLSTTRWNESGFGVDEILDFCRIAL